MAEWVKVARAADLPEGRAKVVEAKGRRIALARAGGEVFAVQDLCTHDNGPLGEGEVADHTIECPRHGARFDVKTGQPVTLPAVIPVSAQIQDCGSVTMPSARTGLHWYCSPIRRASGRFTGDSRKLTVVCDGSVRRIGSAVER